MLTIILAIAIFWLALSIVIGTLFARMARLQTGSQAPTDETEVGLATQLQLASVSSSGRRHAA
ncbi:MAG TPA: hypothetical protein VKH20_00110 [Solirubrobacterales bacterium]|nr:hypothetical protein [Solirubrobacterales bacterium]